MPAYAVGYLAISDPSWLADYVPKTEALVTKHGGRYLVRGGRMETLEGGKALPDAIVVLEFPSLEQARAWYNDTEYAPLIAMRQAGSRLDFVLVEGMPPG